MKQILGYMLIALILLGLFIATCIAYGWITGIIAWGIAAALALVFAVALLLIESGE